MDVIVIDKTDEETLLKEIKEMKRQILLIRNELLELYDSDHLKPELPNYKRRRTLLTTEDTNDIYTTDAMKCCFYQTFLNMRSEQNSSDFKIAFRNEEDEVYCAKFNQIEPNVFMIDKYHLPIFITPDQFISNINYIPSKNLPDVLFSFFKCINSFTDRKNQIKRVNALDDKIGKLSASVTNTVIRFKLPIVDKNKEDIDAVIIIKYNELETRPTNIAHELSDQKLSAKQEQALIKKCEVFIDHELVDAYKMFCGL